LPLGTTESFPPPLDLDLTHYEREALIRRLDESFYINTGSASYSDKISSEGLIFSYWFSAAEQIWHQ